MIPELQEIGAVRRVLPLGRYQTTMDELRNKYVPEDNANRREIWDAFQEVTAVVQQAYGRLSAVWIGGSFITSEEVPHDIDVVYLVDGDAYNKAASDPRGQFVTQVLLHKNPLVKRLNDRVDSSLLPVPPTEYGYDYNYMVTRGYWDQFWSKARFAEGNDRWHYPAAGYLEVIIDGYDA